MGIFSFLKKRQAKELALAEVPQYLQEYLERLSEEQGFPEYLAFLKEKEQEIRDCLEALETGELLNKNVPERAIHLLDGNKKAFIRRTERLLKSTAHPETIEDIPSFLADLDKEIASYGEDTKKNYLIIKEFLEDELVKVVRAIHETESRTAAMHRRAERPLRAVARIRDILAAVDEHMTGARARAAAERETKREIERLEHEEKDIEARIRELKKGTAYNERLAAEKKEEGLLALKKGLASDLNTLFAELERPLKKYKHAGVDEGLIDHYLRDAPSALLNDPDLKVHAVLEKLGKELPGLGLDGKRAARIASLVQRTTRDSLALLRQDLSRVHEELNDIRKAIGRDGSKHDLARHEAHLASLQKKREELKARPKHRAAAIPAQELDLELKAIGATLRQGTSRRKHH